jgi:hypothetical protein
VSSGGGRAWSTLLASGFGGLGLKTIDDRFTGLGFKTRVEVPKKKRTARGGIEEFASRRSYLMKGAVAVG